MRFSPFFVPKMPKTTFEVVKTSFDVVKTRSDVVFTTSDVVKISTDLGQNSAFLAVPTKKVEKNELFSDFIQKKCGGHKKR